MKTIAIILMVVLTALLIVGCARFASQTQQQSTGSDGFSNELDDIGSSLDDPTLEGPDLVGDLTI